MAQLQPERQLEEDSLHAFNDVQCQYQWSRRTEPPTPTPAVVAVAEADEHPHHHHHHEKKSVLKKVKDKAKKLKASLTKSKKQGRDHEEEDDDSASDYDEQSSPSTGGSVEGASHSMSALNAFGTRDPFPKNPEAPKPGISRTSPESISSTGFYDPQDSRAAPGFVLTNEMNQCACHQTDRALSNSFGGMTLTLQPIQATTTEIMPAAARPGNELQHVCHISTDAIPRRNNNAHGQLEFMKTTVRDPSEVPAVAPITINVMVPEGIMKPVMEKSNMESPLKPADEGKFQADVGAPPIIRQAEAALASLDKSTPGLGHEEYMDGKGRPASAKVEGRIVGANVVPSQGGERHSAKSWGEWTPGELQYGKDTLQGSIAPQQEKQGFGARKTSNSGDHVKAMGNEKLWEEARDAEGRGYTQKMYHTAGTAKDVVLSKLGCGGHEPAVLEEKPKSLTEQNDLRALESYNTGKSYAADNLWGEAPDGEGKGSTQKIYDTAGTAKDRAIGNQKRREETRDGEGKGYAQKIYATAGTAKDKATGNEKRREEARDAEGKRYAQKIYATPGTTKDKVTGNEKRREAARDAEGQAYTHKIYDTAGTAEDKATRNEKLREEARDAEGEGYTQKLYDTAGAAKDKATRNEKRWEEARDAEGKGYTHKINDTAGTAKDVILSKLGYGGHEPAVLEEKPKSLTEQNDLSAAESYNTGKSYPAHNLWAEARDGEGKGYTQKINDTAGTAKDEATGNDKRWKEARDGEGKGYTQKSYATAGTAKDKATGNEKLWEEARDAEGKGYTQKIYATPATAKDKATGNEKRWEEARDAEGKGYTQKVYATPGTAKDKATGNEKRWEEACDGAGKGYTQKIDKATGNEKRWEEARGGEGKGYTQKIYATAGTAMDKATGNEKLCEEARDAEGKGYTQKIYPTAGTAKDKATGNEKFWEEARGGEGKGYAQKFYATAGTAMDAMSSKLGYGVHEPAVLEEKRKSLTEENDLGAPESYNTGKSYAADNLSPLCGTASTAKNVTASEAGYGGQSDVQRETSKTIIEEKHVTAIYHVVGGGEGNESMRSSMVNADAVSHGAAFGKNSVAGEYADASEGSSPAGKGIVGRVTEAVSSLLGMKNGEQLSDTKQADILVRRRKEEWRLEFPA